MKKIIIPFHFEFETKANRSSIDLMIADVSIDVKEEEMWSLEM